VDPGATPGGAGGVVEGGDHAGHLGAVGAGRSGDRRPAAGAGAANEPADPGQVGDPGHHAGVDHGHGLAGPGRAGVVGRDHVGAVVGALVGLEVPADAGVAVVDPPQPVGLGRRHPGPVGQPPGGGADVGAAVELDDPGAAAPGQDLAVDRGRGRPPALLPRPGREPDQHPPGHVRVPPGPLPDRGLRGWGPKRRSGGCGHLGPGRLGGRDGRGQGQAGQHHRQRQEAGERGPTGHSHGVRSLFASASDPMTGSAGTRRSLPRRPRSSGEAQETGRLSRPGRSGLPSWPRR
jgi:hypothetical protein